jgi:sporulation protein YlmC with PRC-barrel domain
MSEGFPNRHGVIASSDRLPSLIAADKLTGEKVVNEAGEHIGEIVHLMLNIAEGTIAYAVLSFGGLLGIGDKLFAVPWHSLAIDVDNKWFVLNVERDRLKAAPGFDKNNWPSMADPAWANEVHSYYGPMAISRRPFI